MDEEEQAMLGAIESKYSDNKTPTMRQQLRRRTEDVDYWRKRAGWFDDDQAMKDYNNGVYDTYYQLDDDKPRSSGGGRLGGAANSEMAKNAIKVLSVVVALGLCFLMFRVISRRLTEGKKEKKKRSSSTSRGERSKSRSRSRSRSRKGDYDLMSDDDDGKSNRSKNSNRSRSKSRRSRSRSKSRARSHSASRKESKSSPVAAEPVLV
jgi:hypothetical protein